ncbi:hypothetical protein G6F70_001196 [Rhizopus microsporus]|uniref:RNA helicase n=2 Tax=Rhizopus TaxID=4842 RepID=A0A367JUU9_RHIAZ|nr:hypothetical protein G6F71_004391 [Rhizopus microsporus]RCH93451.1 hypothetical protein CU097_011319 [Rhizopus azygosporus]KAG1203677.1 hypothetical protein G6F70_001196 [Rhizopus microsporus]KAG1211709.1 hypothetical protein G6F69_004366 [Rhizopus microsporus]KAG1233937.1 hypothetical protein G6F67_003896 [Rhizopus microsporus]
MNPRLIQRRWYTSTSFKQLGLSLSTCQRLQTQFHVTQPTRAQQEFIPHLLAGKRDLLLRDATGTGKSFGIALSLASLVPATSGCVHSLYIAPNQELATQIGQWIQQLTPHAHQVQVIATSLTEKPPITHTVVGTPNRILEYINQGQLPVHALDRLILDEADQAFALPRKYAPLREKERRARHPKPAEQLLEKIKHGKHRTVITSATLNRPLRFFLSKRGFVRDPLFVDLQTTTVGVKHHCLLVSDDRIRNIRPELIKQDLDMKQKLDFDDTDDRLIESIATLHEIESVSNGILFIDSTISVEAIKERLAEYQVQAHDIKEYSSLGPQPGALWVATEFTARGVDIPGASHVFILGKPSSTAAYLHMAGRTGRLGPSGFSQGKVFSLVRDQGWTEAKMKNMFELLNIPVEHYEFVE